MKRPTNPPRPLGGSKDTSKKPAGFIGPASSSDYYRCHYGTIPVFTVKTKGDVEVEFCGGGKSRGLSLVGTDLFINLANIYTRSVKLNEAAKQYKSLAELDAGDIPTISIDWPDYSVPNVPDEFWVDLADAILKFATETGKKKVRVTVACQGGHGRTGTALSILACLLSEVPPDEDPVKWIRERYCHNAVETESQLDYIEEITGCTVTANLARGYKGALDPPHGWVYNERDEGGDY